MSQEIIEIKIESEDVRQFNRLVAEYGDGDPSQFLTFAIRKLARESQRSKLGALQQEARKDMIGRVFSSEETLALIRDVKQKPEH